MTAAPAQQAVPLQSRRILGVRVDSTSYADATQRIIAWAKQRQSRYVCLATVNNIMEAHDCLRYAEVLEQADLVTSDGMPLVWMLRVLGLRDASRVYGPDLTQEILAAAEREQVTVGFYGGTDPLLTKLLSAIQQRDPKLQIGFSEAPPFRPATLQEDQRTIRNIQSSKVQVLFAGLGSTKQDKWMRAHRGQIDCVMLGVGAAFDYLAGAKSQAPHWMQRSGLEWLFRLATEPRRLGRRYLKHNPRFVLLALWQLLRGSGKGEPRT